jgi:hypothetical protein
LIQPALMAEAARFVFTTEASLGSASVAALRRKTHKKVSVINSGFGFPDAAPRIARGRVPRIAYLGTVDFAKMHPGFFDAIDALGDDSVRVAVWGRSIRRASWSRVPTPCDPRHGGDSNTRDVCTGFHDPLARHACRAGPRLRFRECDRFDAGRMVPVDATPCRYGLGT